MSECECVERCASVVAAGSYVMGGVHDKIFQDLLTVSARRLSCWLMLVLLLVLMLVLLAAAGPW